MACFSETGRSDDLSDEEIQDLRDAFSMIDRDRDGLITARELGEAIAKLGQYASEAELNIMIERVDRSGQGSIDFDTFLEMMVHEGRPADLEKELRIAFDVLDKDSDGFISALELSQVMRSLGEKLTNDEVHDMIQEADKDGDGRVSYKEFMDMTMNSAVGGPDEKT